MKNFKELVKKWKTHTFSSNSYMEEDGVEFMKDFKSALLKEIRKEDITLERFSTGHYCFYGFLLVNNIYIYFSSNDIRHFPLDWRDNILIRKAETNEDFTGGPNNFTSLEDFISSVKSIANSNIN